jgi:RNA polymerase sigma factor for flagellar operon FliA
MMQRSYSDRAQDPDHLITSHLNLARRIAWQIHGRVGKRLEIDDLLQVAYTGLMDAARRYVPQPGVGFAAYAGIRIRGALMDHLRSLAGQARGTLRQMARLRAAEHKLEQALLRTPTEPEQAAEMGMTVAELSRLRQDRDSGQEASLEDIYTDQSLLFRDPAPSAEDRMDRELTRTQLRAAIAKLPEREALVLQLYYVEDLNVYEIGDILKVTTGRVSQIKKAAIERLQKLMQDPGKG